MNWLRNKPKKMQMGWAEVLDQIDALVITNMSDTFQLSNGSQTIHIDNDAVRYLIKLARRGFAELDK